MNLIGGFLGNDSSFGKLMTKAGTIIAANVLFVICCVPFVTIGAAQKALYYTIFSMINAEDSINPFTTFWQGLKRNFVRTTLYWLIFIGIMMLGGIDLQVCSQTSGKIKYFSAGIIAVMCAVLIIAMYLFPLLAVYSEKVTEVLKRSVFFAFRSPLRLLLVLVVNVVPLSIYILDEANRSAYGFIGAFFGFGLIGYITGKLLNPLIQKYPERIVLAEEKSL